MGGVIAVAITFVALIIGSDFNPKSVGAFFLAVLGILSGADVTRATQGAAAGLFSAERGSHVLSLLFLSGLSCGEIFFAKLSGVLIKVLHRVLLVIPCFAVTFLMLDRPGIDTLLLVAATMLGWVLFVLSMNVLASVIVEDESAARLIADGGLVLVCALPPIINSLNKLLGGVPLDSNWLLLSPAYAFVRCFEAVAQNGPLEPVLWAILISVGYSCVLLAIAAAILARVWRYEVKGSATALPLMDGLQEWFRARQRKRAAAMLALNPYAWLVTKDFRPVLGAWIAIGAVIAIWLIGLWKWSRFWLLPVNFWVTCLALGEVIRWLAHYFAARQIGKDRASGGLELVLTSPLSPAEIVSGQELVTQRYIRPLNRLLIGVYVIFFVTGLFCRAWTKEALASYVIVWLFVAALAPWTPWSKSGHWLSFWVSLHTGRPGYALRRRLIQNGSYAGVAFQAYFHSGKFSGFPYGTPTELIILGIMLATALVLSPFFTRGQTLKPKIVEELREVAQHPPPAPDDPALKTWNTNESFYAPQREKIVV